MRCPSCGAVGAGRRDVLRPVCDFKAQKDALHFKALLLGELAHHGRQLTGGLQWLDVGGCCSLLIHVVHLPCAVETSISAIGTNVNTFFVDNGTFLVYTQSQRRRLV